MELTIVESLIAAGSALLCVGVFGRYVGPRLKYWLELTRAAKERERGRTDVSDAQLAFQQNLRVLTARTSLQGGPTPEAVEQGQLHRTIAQSRTLAS